MTRELTSHEDNAAAGRAEERDGLPNPFASPTGAPEQGVTVDDLAMLVRLLVRALRKSSPDSTLAAQAMDYLERKALTGSPLRAETAAPSGQEVLDGTEGTHPDTRRLDWLEAEAFKRQLWFQSDVMPKGSLGEEMWGHHRWRVIGQGLDTNWIARAATLRESIDIAAQPSDASREGGTDG